MVKVTHQKNVCGKNYHTLINNIAGYAHFVRVGYLHLCSIFSLAFERKLNTGCGKAFNIAFPNRQGAALLFNSADDPRPKTNGFLDLLQPDHVRLYTRFFVLDVREGFAKGRLSAKDRKIAYNLGGSSKGATRFMFISPLGEKKIN